MLSILQLSDLHLLAKPEDKIVGINTDYYFQACLEQAVRMRSPRFDLILLTGDLAQEPCVASYQRILNRLDMYQTPCICLPGNHDDFELMQQILMNSQWGSCQKQAILNNWLLICLNSQIPGKEGGYLSMDELQFLEDSLAKNPDYHALIAIHHHCLATLSRWMDTMIIENNQALWAIVNKYPQVKAITTGHIHQVMDIKAGHVRVLGTPSTCYQFTPESSEFSIDNMAPGYRIIELYADGRIETEVIRLDESLVGLELECHGY
jgi:Icc protein